MIREDALRDYVRELEKMAEECADEGLLFVLDGRSVTKTLRAVLDNPPEYKPDGDAAKERLAAIRRGGTMSVRAIAMGWTKGGER